MYVTFYLKIQKCQKKQKASYRRVRDFLLKDPKMPKETKLVIGVGMAFHLKIQKCHGEYYFWLSGLQRLVRSQAVCHTANMSSKI